MASFPGFYLTGAGMRLQAKAQAGAELVYTKMAVGDGNLLSGQNIEDLTALVNWKLDLGIDSVNAPGDGTAHLKSILSNNGLSTGFVVKEIGIFAQDPDDGEIMYAYTNAGAAADYLPASGGSTVIEKNITAIISVGNAANIAITIPSANFATKEDLANYARLDLFNEHQRINRLWQPATTYVANDIVYSNKIAAISYQVFECVIGGKTGSIEPNWTTVGSTVVDGTVTWRVLDLRGVTANQTMQSVRRDANGNFSAGTIAADLSGNATTASALKNARVIAISGAITASASFDGSKSITLATSGMDVGKTDAGILPVKHGGTGTASINGLVKGNGAGAFSAAVAGVDYAPGNLVPRGVICMWSGTIETIPSGWALCNGQNGTPNLLDRFIVGAGSGYGPWNTGGEAYHVLSWNEMPVHSHNLFLGNSGNNTPDPGAGFKRSNVNDGHSHVQGRGWGYIENSGGNWGHENRPPYFALAYIMKL